MAEGRAVRLAPLRQSAGTGRSGGPAPRSRQQASPHSGRGGFTLVEILIVLVVAGIVLSIVAPSFRGLQNELRNASSETSSFFRQTRSAALSSTSAYRVIVVSNTRFRTEFAADCSESTWQPDSRIDIELRDGVVFEGAAIQAGTTLVCYGSRGVADASPTFDIRDRQGRAERVDLFIGGAIMTSPTP